MIDGGPLRTSRPTRQVEYPEPTARSQAPEVARETEQPAAPAMQPAGPTKQYRKAEPQPEEQKVVAPKSPRNLAWLKWVGLVAIFLVLAAVGWMLWPNNRSVTSTIDPDKYQAVFLSNGQVYFGKLTVVDSDYMKLTSVYYLERQLDSSSNDQQPATEDKTTTQNGDNNFKLLKYSDVLYGSEDAMVISRDDIIRYENLRPDGVVAKAIANRS